ncbi:hypothetical protein [Rhizobium rhizogenes]|uniref:hypothetical protein n=1 Tax=Rhizobium rhizogenes TaxID=359 RepID=UPI0028698A13|nr:hypothetical protein [Rhizobium rhizogenes]
MSSVLLGLADTSAARPVSLWSGAGSVGIDGTAQSCASMSITATSGLIAAATLLSKDDLAIAGNASGGHNGAVINRSGLVTSHGKSA